MHQTVARAQAFGAVPYLSVVSAARALVDLAPCSCYAGLEPAVTKGIGTIVRRKGVVMLQHVATLLAGGIAAGFC